MARKATVLNQNQSWNLSLEGAWNSTTVNGITENRTFNEVYEILTSNSNHLTHDRKGNLTQNKDASQYTWDYNNQLSHAVNASSESASYTYDALGRRISKQVNGTLTVYVSVGYQITTEYQSTDGINFTEKQSYVYATYVDDPLVLVKASGERFYYHSNGQFNISKITDEYKNVVEAYAYNAYGDVQILQSYAGLDNPYYFTGRQLDQEIGLFYFRARYYDAKLGQFISRDPIGYVDGLSLYRGYFAINGVDWSGMDDTTSHPWSTPRYADDGVTVIAFGNTKLPWWKKMLGSVEEIWDRDIRMRGTGNISKFSFDNSTNIIADPVETMVKELKSIIEKSENATCVSVLNIVGHGFVGAGISSRMPKNSEDDINIGISGSIIGTYYGKKIAESLCKDAVVNLCGCWTAWDEVELQTMANKIGRKVCGCKGPVTPPCECTGFIVCKTPQ